MMNLKNKIECIKSKIENASSMLGGSLNYVYKGTYKGEQVILKVYNPMFWECSRRFHNELETLRANPGLKIPKIVEYSLDEMWIISQFAEGQSLNEREVQGNKIDLGSLISTLKEIHLTSINRDTGWDNKYLDWLIKKLEIKVGSSGIEGHLQGSVERGMKWLSEQKHRLKRIPLGLVNGDLNGGNILLDSDGRVRTIVDWEFSHIGNKYLDLAKLTSKEGDLSEAILDFYFGDEFDEDLYRFFSIYSLMRIVLNNSPTNIKNMASVSGGKMKIVQDKSKKLVEIF